MRKMVEFLILATLTLLLGVSGLEYTVVHQKATYQQARELCESQGGKLPTPKTKAENDMLDGYTSGTDIFFIGLRDGTEGTWLWDDGAFTAWTNWRRAGESYDDAEPNGGGAENCAVLMKKRGDAEHTHRWADFDCGREVPLVVCQNVPSEESFKDVVSCTDTEQKTLQCEAGLKIHIVQVYYGWTPDVHGEMMSRVDDGDSTACVKNKYTQTDLEGAWIDNQVMTDIIYPKCNHMQQCTVQDSYQLYGDPIPGGAKYFRVKYICRQDGCKPGWVESGSVCIKLTDENLSWNEGRRACEALGAKLATPATLTAMEDLVTTANAQQWPIFVSIGLSRYGPDDWMWLDGRPMTYSFWEVPNPSNTGGNEKCVEMQNQGHGGRANDVPCDYTSRGPAACQLPQSVKDVVSCTDGDEKTLQCEAGLKIHIVQVYYGWTQDVHDGMKSRVDDGDSTACVNNKRIQNDREFAWIDNQNMTDIIYPKCNHMQQCTVQNSYLLYGDPIQGGAKYFRVNYICRQVTLAEVSDTLSEMAATQARLAAKIQRVPLVQFRRWSSGQGINNYHYADNCVTSVDQAQDACAAHGWYLAEIDDAAEAAHAFRFVRLSTKSISVFTGARDSKGDGNWTFVGSGRPATYTPELVGDDGARCSEISEEGYKAIRCDTTFIRGLLCESDPVRISKKDE